MLWMTLVEDVVDQLQYEICAREHITERKYNNGVGTKARAYLEQMSFA